MNIISYKYFKPLFDFDFNFDFDDFFFYDDDNRAYCFKKDMPGFEKEEIDISVDDDGYLTIKAESSEKTRKKVNLKFYLSDKISKDVDDINAEYRNGVLKIEIKDKEKTKNIKKIQLN